MPDFNKGTIAQLPSTSDENVSSKIAQAIYGDKDQYDLSKYKDLDQVNPRNFEKDLATVVPRFKGDEPNEGLLMSFLKLGGKILLTPFELSATIYAGATAAVFNFVDILAKDVEFLKFSDNKTYYNPVTRFLADQSTAMFKTIGGILIDPVVKSAKGAYELSYNQAQGGLTILQKESSPDVIRPSASPVPAYASFIGPKSMENSAARRA